MKRFILALALLFAVNVFADGTVATPPAAQTIGPYRIEGAAMNANAGPANVTILVVYDNTDGTTARSQTIVLTGTQIRDYLVQMRTAVAGEPAGTTLANEAKKWRMRADKFLRDNALLLYPVTPES